MLINPYASTLASGPWLFDDLKRHFRNPRFDHWGVRDGVDEPFYSLSVSPTEAPDPDADAWICIRAWEVHLTPDPARTIVQIHCNEPRLWGELGKIDRCAAIVYTHPCQIGLMPAAGVSIDKPSLIRPIGALRAFTLRDEMHELPSFGWIGRDTGSNKRTDLFRDAIARCAGQFDLRAVCIGSQLDGLVSELCGTTAARVDHHHRLVTPIGAYPALYRTLDAIVITSVDEAGPMPLFEALATGVPVVTTDCGWARHFIEDGINGYIVEPHEIADRLLDIASHRSEWFARRQLIRATLRGWTLEDWIEDNVRLAIEVVR